MLHIIVEAPRCVPDSGAGRRSRQFDPAWNGGNLARAFPTTARSETKRHENRCEQGQVLPMMRF
jgi:hypothetical protein